MVVLLAVYEYDEPVARENEVSVKADLGAEVKARCAGRNYRASLAISRLEDESLADSDNLPPPEVIWQEILEDVAAAPEQFRVIAADLGAGEDGGVPGGRSARTASVLKSAAFVARIATSPLTSMLPSAALKSLGLACDDQSKPIETGTYKPSTFVEICGGFARQCPMSSEIDQAVLRLARQVAVLRASDLAAISAPRSALAGLARRGLLARVGRGLYSLPDEPASEKRSLAEVARRVPRGIVCLLSALQVHKLTTQVPHEVWLAIGRNDWKPVIDKPRVRVVRFSGPAMTEGVERHVIDGVSVPVFGVDKTLADCFKYRNKIGLDVALEALREAWIGRRVSMDELWRYAVICRVTRVMRPYLEALVR